jgi:hypothetical protein
VADHKNRLANSTKSPAQTPAPAPITNELPNPGVGTNTLADLGAYREMYLPVNEELFKKQQASFQKLLQLLRENKIPTVVVDMPLTDANLALLPRKTLSEYKSCLQNTCTINGARVWSPQLNLALSDFSDSAHMNASGGKKFFAALDSYLFRLAVEDKRFVIYKR